jgi:hypothetical protein
MKYTLIKFVRVLGVLTILIFAVGLARADPVITFSSGGTHPTPINNLSPFDLHVGADGTLTVTLSNATDFLFTDFHFAFAGAAVPSGSGGTFFTGPPSFTSGHATFFQGGTGTGIEPFSGAFTITFSGFSPGTVITARASTIPEPTAMILLGTGLVGVAAKVRSRRRRGKRRVT